MGAGLVSQTAHPLVILLQKRLEARLMRKNGLTPPTPKKRRTRRVIDAPLKVLPIVSYDDGFDLPGF
jgi:hypothetical protein